MALGGNEVRVTAFEMIVEAMPFETEEERLVWAAMFCRNFAGGQINVPVKQQEREIARLMFEKGVDFDIVKQAVSMNHRTLRNIQNEVKNES